MQLAAGGGGAMARVPKCARTRGAWVAVLFLVVVAGALRFYKLGTWSVWGDEIYTCDAAQEWLKGRLSSPFRVMPLAFLPTPISMAMFGSPVSEFAIRFFPALLGSLAIAILFAFVDWFLGRREAFVAATLATFCPWLVFQSQFARYYSQLLLLSTASAFLYYAAVQRGRAALMMGSVVCFVLAGLTHPTAYFLLPSFALHFAVAKRLGVANLRWRLMLPYALVVAGALVTAAINLAALRGTIGYSLELKTDGADTPIDVVQGLAYNLGVQIGLLGLIGLPLVWKVDRSKAVFLLCLAAVPFAMIVALAAMGRSVGERYLIPSLAAYFALAASPLAELDRRLARARPRLACVTTIAAVLPYLPALVSHYLDGDRHDMRQAAQFVAARATARDCIVADQHRLFAWYAGYPMPERVEEAPPPSSRPRLVRKIQNWSEGALWVVIPEAFEKSAGDRGEFARWTEQHCRLVAEFHVPRYDYHQNILRVYRRNQP